MATRMAAYLVIGAALLLLPACQSGGPRQPDRIAASGDRALAKADYALAEREYQQVVEAQPWNARARRQYGRALLGVGKEREAREQLEKAYTIRPGDGETISALAEAMARSGDYEGAVRFLQSVAEDRKRPEDWTRLGLFAQKAKDYDTAERALLTAARGDGGLTVEPQMRLFELYAEVGRDREAMERLAMAYWLQPSNPRIAEEIRARGQTPGPAFAKRPAERTGN